MSGNPETIRDRLGEAAQGAYSADVASLNALVDRLSRSPAASVADQALLGRIRSSARLLDQPVRLKSWAERRLMAGQAGLSEGHLGRGCIND